MWESFAGVVAVLVSVVLFFLWAVPSMRDRPPTSSPDAQFVYKYDVAFFEYQQRYWWGHILHFIIYVADAFAVLCGLSEIVSTEFQLAIVLLFSVLRTAFFVVFAPAQGRKENGLHVMNSFADTVQVLLLYSMIGKQRTSTWNHRCTSVVAVAQAITVIINVLVSLYDLIGKLVAFIIYWYQRFSEPSEITSHNSPVSGVPPHTRVHSWHNIAQSSLRTVNVHNNTRRLAMLAPLDKRGVYLNNPLALWFKKTAQNASGGQNFRQALEHRASSAVLRQSPQSVGLPIHPETSSYALRQLLVTGGKEQMQG
jgi:hypothetical protein